MKPLVSAFNAWTCVVISMFAIVILSVIGSMFANKHHSMMGSDEDPEDGGKVAAAVFGAVGVYGVSAGRGKRRVRAAADKGYMGLGMLANMGYAGLPPILWMPGFCESETEPAGRDCLAWQAAYDDLAAYVWPKEPTTMTYYFGIPLDYADDFSKTTSMLAFEVYGCREDLYGTHLNSPAMAEFLSIVPAHTTTDLDLNHYEAVGGFLDREGDKQECAIMLDIRIACKTAAAQSVVVKNMQGLISAVIGAELGPLTFMAFSSLDNDTNTRLFGRFESREALERFVRGRHMLAFWRQCREDIASMESRSYVPNGKGWLHRNT
ncbi:hypothetical protein LTR17_014040 [Elasticomyces elasticus]|nr:hypothetical protein LTR17_014040 [Elasticomyces elasticus]